MSARNSGMASTDRYDGVWGIRPVLAYSPTRSSWTKSAGGLVSPLVLAGPLTTRKQPDRAGGDGRIEHQHLVRGDEAVPAE